MCDPHPIFTDGELEHPYKLPPTTLPSKTDVLRFVLSRTITHKHKHDSVVRELAIEVGKIWNDADCCPYSRNHIITLFEKEVWSIYKYVLREKHLPLTSSTTPTTSATDSATPAKKRSHKKDPSKPSKYGSQPRRKSSRLDSTSSSLPSDENVTELPPRVLEDIPLASAPSGTVNTRSSVEHSLALEWGKEGKKLFDVKSERKVIEVVNKGLCFDKDFYEDQCGKRDYVMVVGKVTKEFIEEDIKRKKRETVKERNRLSACGIIQQRNEEIDLPEEESYEDKVEDDNEYNEGNICSSFHRFNFSYYTRNKEVEQEMNPRNTFRISKNTEVQTEPYELIGDVPVRIVNKKNKCNLVEPRYLEAISLLMSENLSASEAIKAVHIIDTVVWGQIRILPLRLDKVYMNSRKKLKKLDMQKNDQLEHEELVNPEDTIENQMNLVENISERILTSTTPLDNDNADNPEIAKLKTIIKEKLELRQQKGAFTLPNAACARHNHNLVAVYCESKIGEELMEKTGFIMPDGTSRQGVGDVAANVTKIGDKFRALKTVKITQGTTNNWATAIVYMLKRLSVASNNDIQSIWQNVSAMVSDLCKVNRTLATEIQTLLGSSWQPGQAFCNLHFTLAIPEAIKSVLEIYQSQIGAEKLFPKTVGFEMNIEDKLIVIQILDCWMRLTSIRWQSRAWNKYRKFTDFAEKRGVQNVGHMLHANRFGEFEERCAGGLYLADVWVEWLKTFSDVRNQLGCFLREVECLMEQCKFLWAGIALVGIHITVPFMSMILDHKVTPRQLLVILPKLYADLKSYPLTLCTTEKCGIPSMTPYFLNPHKKETSPYGTNVCQSLSVFLKSVNVNTMDVYLKTLCSTIADALKRQRGNQYGFGDDPNSIDLVTKNLTDDLLDDSDVTHTKPIENYFGNFDRELEKTGSQGFDKATDDLIIKYSRDLIGDDHKWRTKEIRKKAIELKVLEKEFNQKQRELVEMGIDEEDAMVLSHQNSILNCIEKCKSLHGGPVTTSEELDNLINTWSGTEKSLHKSLNYEIRLRKYSFTKIKADNALFKQQNLSIADKKRNLLCLICSQLELRTLAEMVDLEDAIINNANPATLDTNKNAPSQVEEQDATLLCPVESMDGGDHENMAEDVDIWPPKVGQYVYGLFEDGVFPGEVLSVSENNVEVDTLVRATVPNMQSDESLWKRSSYGGSSKYSLHRNSILPFYPVVIINRYSTRRVTVFQFLNYDIASKIFD